MERRKRPRRLRMNRGRTHDGSISRDIRVGAAIRWIRSLRFFIAGGFLYFLRGASGRETFAARMYEKVVT